MSKQNRPAVRHRVVLGTVLTVVTLMGLIGCAADPIRPWYVPPTNYQALSCDALHAEYDRVGRYLHRGVDTPRSVFSGMSVGLGGFGWGGGGWGWSPSMSFSQGEVVQDQRSVYARMLGEQDAIQSQAAYKGCPIVVAAAS